MRMERGRKRTGCIAAMLSIVMLLGTACGNGAETAATTMHLMRTQGAVGVVDEKGKDVETAEQLKLYSGYQVDTQEESYAWINLDNVKLTKMDSESEIEIRKEGKALDIEVKSGSLFFNVTEPLEEDETLNIRTSTTAVGIRGTCGWVEVDEYDHLRLYLIEGEVEYTYEDPDSGETQTMTVSEKLIAEMKRLEDGSFVLNLDMPSVLTVPDFVLEEVGEEMFYSFEEFGIWVKYGRDGEDQEAMEESGSAPEEPEESTSAPEPESKELTLTMPVTADDIFSALWQPQNETVIVESNGEEAILDVEYMGVPEGKTLILGEGISLNIVYIDPEEYKDGGLTVSGNAVINGNLINNGNGMINVENGTLTVNGSIENGPDCWILVGSRMGEINPDARLVVTGGITSSGYLWNYSTIEGDITLTGGELLQRGEVIGEITNNGAAVRQ